PWVSDGRPAGNRLLADVNRSSLGSLPRQLAASGGGLFFTACHAARNRQLFRTAGSGTTAPLTTGGAAYCDIDVLQPLAVVTAGGTGYFLRDEATYDPRLWKSDGTPAGTAPLGGFRLNTSPLVAAFGGRLLFTADDPDGSAASGTAGTAH